ncbi:hypothetical protein OfM1_11730 [Lactovum odontotermitis]
MKENKTGLTEGLIGQILDITRLFPEITGVRLYGSRARGTQRKYSDVDLALFGDFDERVTAEVRGQLEELDTIFEFDVVHFESLKDEALKKNIEVDGMLL